MRPCPLRFHLLAAASPTALAAVLAAALSSPATADPQGGTVTRGTAAISGGGLLTTIDQSSARALIEWDSFDIDAGETVRFNQPDVGSVTLNRVLGGTATAISGRLQANGHVWVMNGNGVTIRNGAEIDVGGGFIASTTDIADDDFMAGRDRFTIPGEPGARVINEGRISFGEAGLAGLVGAHAENRGEIVGQLGTVLIGGRETLAVDLAGDGLFAFEMDPGTLSSNGVAVAGNSGSIANSGGRVIVSAAAAEAMVDAAVSIEGLIAADTLGSSTGRVEIDAGDGLASVTGTVTARGAAPASDGGQVSITGGAVDIAPDARIDASGTAQGGRVLAIADQQLGFSGGIDVSGGTGAGGFVDTSAPEIAISGLVDAGSMTGPGGEWLIDPQDLFISTDGGNVDAFSIASTLEGGGSVTLNSADFVGTEVGNITLVDGLDGLLISSGTPTLTLNATGGVTLQSSIAQSMGPGVLSVNLNAQGGDVIGVAGAEIFVDGDVSIQASGDIALVSPIDTFGLTGSSLNAGGQIEIPTGSFFGVGLTATAGLDIFNSGSFSVEGPSSFTSFTGSIDLDGAFLSSVDSHSFTAPGLVSIGSGSGLSLGPVSAGDLTILSRGDLTQTAPISVSGNSNLSAFDFVEGFTQIFDITLTDAANEFGSLTAFGNIVSVTDTDGIQLGAITAETLTVQTGGTITDTDGQVISVNNGASFLAGTPSGPAYDIVIDAQNTHFMFGDIVLLGEDIYFANESSITFGNVSARGTEIDQTFDDLYGTTFGQVIRAAGPVFQAPGATFVVTPGSGGPQITDVTAGVVESLGSLLFDVTLDNAGNDFGSISAIGSALFLADVNDLDVFTSSVFTTVDISAGGALTLDAIRAPISLTADAARITARNLDGNAVRLSAGLGTISVERFRVEDLLVSSDVAVNLTLRRGEIEGSLTLEPNPSGPNTFDTLRLTEVAFLGSFGDFSYTADTLIEIDRLRTPGSLDLTAGDIRLGQLDVGSLTAEATIGSIETLTDAEIDFDDGSTTVFRVDAAVPSGPEPSRSASGILTVDAEIFDSMIVVQNDTSLRAVGDILLPGAREGGVAVHNAFGSAGATFGAIAGGTVAVETVDAILLGDVSAGAALVVRSNSDNSTGGTDGITQQGVVIADGSASFFTGVDAFANPAERGALADVVLDDISNSLGGPVYLSARNATVVDQDAALLTIADSRLSGTLDVAALDVTITDTVVEGGLTATGLTGPGFGAVLTADRVAVGGDLTIDTGSAVALSDVAVVGTTVIDAGDAVSAVRFGFGAFDIAAAGSVQLASGSAAGAVAVAAATGIGITNVAVTGSLAAVSGSAGIAVDALRVSDDLTLSSALDIEMGTVAVGGQAALLASGDIFTGAGTSGEVDEPIGYTLAGPLGATVGVAVTGDPADTRLVETTDATPGVAVTPTAFTRLLGMGDRVVGVAGGTIALRGEGAGGGLDNEFLGPVSLFAQDATVEAAGTLAVSDSRLSGDLAVSASAIALADADVTGALSASGGTMTADRIAVGGGADISVGTNLTIRDAQIAGATRLDAGQTVDMDRYAVDALDVSAGVSARLGSAGGGGTAASADVSVASDIAITNLDLIGSLAALSGMGDIAVDALSVNGDLTLSSGQNLTLGTVRVEGEAALLAANDIRTGPGRSGAAGEDLDFAIEGPRGATVGTTGTSALIDTTVIRTTDAIAGQTVTPEQFVRLLRIADRSIILAQGSTVRLPAGAVDAGTIALLAEADAEGGLGNEFFGPVSLFAQDATVEVIDAGGPLAVENSRLSGLLDLTAPGVTITDTVVGSGLTVTDNAVPGGSLTAERVAVGGDLTADMGAAVTLSDLDVAGATTVAGTTVSIDDFALGALDASATGALRLGSATTGGTAGTTRLATGSTLDVTNLQVAGDFVTSSGTGTDLAVDALRVSGDATLTSGSDVTLGTVRVEGRTDVSAVDGIRTVAGTSGAAGEPLAFTVDAPRGATVGTVNTSTLLDTRVIKTTDAGTDTTVTPPAFDRLLSMGGETILSAQGGSITLRDEDAAEGGLGNGFDDLLVVIAGIGGATGNVVVETASDLDIAFGSGVQFGTVQLTMTEPGRDLELFGSLGSETRRVASLDITGARNVTFGRDFFGGGVASLLDSDPTRDVIFVGDLTLTGVTGTVRTARSAETDAIFASNDAFFGVNVLNAFDYSGSRPAAIDVTGAIGAEVDRTPAGGLLPVGDSDTAYTFNSCIIGDAISCGTEVPVTEVPAEYIETEITDVEKIIVVNTLFDLPEIFDVDLQTLADVYVSFGNEWLWASTPAFLVDLEGESE